MIVDLPPPDALDWVTEGDFGSIEAFRCLSEELGRGNVSAIVGAGMSAKLPPPRKPWMTEDCRMSIFDALALAQTSFFPKRQRSRIEPVENQ